ncbi:hypothetical protein Tco_1319998 [Tanacetum coccineum]
MNFLSASLTERITEQVKDQLPQILLEEVSNFAPTVIQRMVTESQFELKKILIDKMDKSESYLAAPEHRECYEGFIKSYDLDKTLLSTYDKVYLLKRSRKDKDKDEDPSTESDRGLKKRKTSKDAEPTKEEPEFEVADSDMPQDHEGNLGNDDEEPKEKTLQQGQNQSWLMTLASSADKQSKTFDELMSTPRDFSTYIMNGLKITNQTQETLLGQAFRLLKGTRSNYATLEYEFEECYKALSEKLDWENPEGGGVSTMTYTTSITNTKVAQYDLPGIEDMVPTKTKAAKYDNIEVIEDMVTALWSPMKVAYDKYTLWVTHVKVMKYDYGYLEEIVVPRDDNSLHKFKEGDFPNLNMRDIEDMQLLLVHNKISNLERDVLFDLNVALRILTRSVVIQKRVEDLQLGVESYQKKLNITRPDTYRSYLSNMTPFTAHNNP